MDIIRSHWLPILAFFIIVVMISIATATDRQSSVTDFDPDYPIGTPPILGGTGCVIETATGWHNAQDWGEYNADYSGYHPGEDWNYGSGTDDVGKPVYAIAAGMVFDIRNALFSDEGGYGSGIAIKHTMPNGEEIYSVYEHIDIMSGLSIGDSVWQGDKIGSIADTTKLSPHLHFEIRTTQMDKNDWYPNDNSYGYYASKEKLHTDGFTIDPSDFLDSHRSTAESSKIGPSSQVTLTLYVHDERADGPVISGAMVTGQDASGNSFEETTNNEGYATITGDSGTWSFSVSADGYEINSWDQEIIYTDSKNAFLHKASEIATSQLTAEEWVRKGNDLSVNGHYDEEALHAYDMATQIDPDYADAWAKKGMYLDDHGKYDEAVQALDKATQISPESKNIWDLKGIALFHQGKYEEAIKAFDRATEIEPLFVDAYYHKGESLKAAGRTTEANAAFANAKAAEKELGL